MSPDKAPLPSTQLTGQRAEILALEYLQQQGLQLITSNFRARTGEIDLIMRDQKFMVFIEVRLRSHKDYGTGIDSVIPRKQQKIIKTAELYLLQKKLYGKVPFRFDIVSLNNLTDQSSIQWLKNAILKW